MPLKEAARFVDKQLGGALGCIEKKIRRDENFREVVIAGLIIGGIMAIHIAFSKTEKRKN